MARAEAGNARIPGPPSLSILRWGVTPTWHDDGYRPGVDCPQGSPPWCLCWGCDPESWAGAQEAQRASAARHSEEAVRWWAAHDSDPCVSDLLRG